MAAAPHEADEPRFQDQVSFPKLAVVDVVDAVPGAGLAAALVPARAEVAIEESEHLGCEPGEDVDAVGDVANGHLVFAPAGP